jgi:hypothetical protein
LKVLGVCAMVLERLAEAASLLESMASRVRRTIKPAESLAESRANSAIYTIAEMLAELSQTLQRMECIAKARESKGKVLSLCTTWRIFERDGGVSAVRIKPETVITVSDGRLFFHRDIYRLEAQGSIVKVCKWNYCKEIDPSDREKIIDELSQIFYLLRGVANMVRKTADSIVLCARKEAPECARI